MRSKRGEQEELGKGLCSEQEPFCPSVWNQAMQGTRVGEREESETRRKEKGNVLHS